MSLQEALEVVATKHREMRPLIPTYGLVDEAGPHLPPKPIRVPKRPAWFLDELVKAGVEGLTSIEFPGVRVSDCVLKLRRAGVNVETQYEPHAGEFAGRHGRFILRSRVVQLAEQVTR